MQITKQVLLVETAVFTDMRLSSAEKGGVHVSVDIDVIFLDIGDVVDLLHVWVDNISGWGHRVQ